MAVQAAEVAPVREVPDDDHWSASGLRIPHPEMGDTLHHVEHALADERVIW